MTPMHNWIDLTGVPFEALLLLERVQIGWLPRWPAFPRAELAIALRAHPSVEWYLRHKCPEISPWLDDLLSAQTAPTHARGPPQAGLPAQSTAALRRPPCRRAHRPGRPRRPDRLRPGPRRLRLATPPGLGLRRAHRPRRFRRRDRDRRRRRHRHDWRSPSPRWPALFTPSSRSPTCDTTCARRPAGWVLATSMWLTV